jgi:hypothetical protein
MLAGDQKMKEGKQDGLSSNVMFLDIIHCPVFI